MTEKILEEHRVIWQEKPVLREIYTDFYRRILAVCQTGLTLEIGGGSGNLKEFVQDVISTDIVLSPWLDAAADAQALPFRDESFANIVMIDVLHHIERPKYFFSEAQRVLKPGGRLVLLEPAITPISWAFYNLMHPEPVIMGVDPFADIPPDPGRKPFDANQAIPTLLFGKFKRQFESLFPELKILENIKLSLFTYPLSGGFRPWSLIPSGWVRSMLRLEAAIAKSWGPVGAFRMFVVIEKNAIN